jgi:predicted Zn-dependent peptidase
MNLMRCGAIVAAASALMSAASPALARRISDDIRHYTLSNGIRVFVCPRPGAPLFTGMILVDAGSAEENAGETGIAHLLEHMAFKGTPWIGTRDWQKEQPILQKIEETGVALNRERQAAEPDAAKVGELEGRLRELESEAAQYILPNEYDTLLTREGAQEVNATTSNDYTNYFMTLPSNKLELWAMMESQRLRFPAWREFYKERDIVSEERRMRVDDSPDGRMYEEFLAAALKAHPYRTPVIGWMSDIRNLDIGKVAAFYRRHYVPSSMVIVLAGDVDPGAARVLLDKYFGTIPAHPAPPRASTVEPPQAGERRVRVEFDAEPQVWIAWHKPTFPDKDTMVFEVIQGLLSDVGRSSRLYERLVKRDQLCQEADSFTAPGDKYPGLFVLHLVPRAPHTAAEAEKAALEEIERLKTEPVSAEELAKVRNQVDTGLLMSIETNLGLARRLGSYYLASGDPQILDRMRDEMRAVTAQDILRVAQKYFTQKGRTVAELVTTRESRPAVELAARLNIHPETTGTVVVPDTATTGAEVAQ